jgi:hypothetical protein
MIGTARFLLSPANHAKYSANRQRDSGNWQECGTEPAKVSDLWRL